MSLISEKSKRILKYILCCFLVVGILTCTYLTLYLYLWSPERNINSLFQSFTFSFPPFLLFLSFILFSFSSNGENAVFLKKSSKYILLSSAVSFLGLFYVVFYRNYLLNDTFTFFTFPLIIVPIFLCILFAWNLKQKLNIILNVIYGLGIFLYFNIVYSPIIGFLNGMPFNGRQYMYMFLLIVNLFLLLWHYLFPNNINKFSTIALIVSMFSTFKVAASFLVLFLLQTGVQLNPILPQLLVTVFLLYSIYINITLHKYPQ